MSLTRLKFVEFAGSTTVTVTSVLALPEEEVVPVLVTVSFVLMSEAIWRVTEVNVPREELNFAKTRFPVKSVVVAEIGVVVVIGPRTAACEADAIPEAMSNPRTARLIVNKMHLRTQSQFETAFSYHFTGPIDLIAPGS